MLVEQQSKQERMHEYYSNRATALGKYLETRNKTAKVLEKWRELQIRNFLGLLAQNMEDLEEGHRQKRITKIAWATRNLLELSIWIEYRSVSVQHAKEIENDVARDLMGFAKAVQSALVNTEGAPNPKLEQSKQNLIKFAEKDLGIPNLDEQYTRVSEAAKEVGRHQEFAALNKGLSKYAHPTAVALRSVITHDVDKGLRGMFFNDGVKLAMDSLMRLEREVLKHFPACHATKD
jgi:hypothetical protein